MGMSTSVYGIKPADEKFKKMRAAYVACEVAGVKPPEDVREFLGNDAPDEKGVVVDLAGYKNAPGVSEYGNESSSGFEVDIRELDPDIKIIRFVNSW